jgi:hypothetical protein
MLLGAHEKLAVISTGGYLSAANNGALDLKDDFMNFAAVPYLNTDFDTNSKSKHYHCFTDLDGVGDVLCVEVSRAGHADGAVAPNNYGYIFVGGSKGVSVLRKSNGNGFDSDVSGSDLEDFSATIATMSFKKIPGILEPIHEMVSTRAFLYLMGETNVYRIRLHSGFICDIFTEDPNPVNNTMFRDYMSELTLDARVNLATLPADTGVVVVQKVRTAGPGEFFLHMVNVPNTGAIVISSMQGESSHLYAIKNGEAVQVEGAEPSLNVYSVDTTNPGAESNYKKTLSYPVRRMYLANYDVTNPYLGDGERHFSSSGTYGLDVGGAPIFGPVANLYVLSGSRRDANSRVYAYEINGTMNTNLLTLRLDNAASWISSEPISGINSLPTGILANGFDLAGVPYIYAHASNDMSLSILTILSQATPMLQKYCGLVGDSKVYGSFRLENGTQMLFGYPFGVATYE